MTLLCQDTNTVSGNHRVCTCFPLSAAETATDIEALTHSKLCPIICIYYPGCLGSGREAVFGRSLLFREGRVARTYVYVDAFNLYFGALRGTPYRWLNVAELCCRPDRSPFRKYLADVEEVDLAGAAVGGVDCDVFAVGT